MEQKIIFKDKQSPIQVFCPQKFKGYYIRGLIYEFSDNIYGDIYPEGYCYAYYRQEMYFLLSPRHDVLANDHLEDMFEFEGKTLAEFLRNRRKYFYSLAKKHPEKNLSLEENLNLYLQNENEPIGININEINIIESPYLQNAIKNKAESILLKILIKLDRAELPSNHAPINCPKHVYTLPAYHLSDESDYYERDTFSSFHMVPGEYPSDEFYFNFMDAKNYRYFFCDIGNISWGWIKKRKLSNKGMEILNILYAGLKDRADPYKEYYFFFLEDLISDLKNNCIIGQCSFCSNFFRYSSAKRYCSLITEGKNCGKRARNQRHYIKHKEKILPKVRNYNKELKAFYKEKGVKK